MLTLKLVSGLGFYSQLVLAKGNGALWATLHPQARVMASPLNPSSKTTFTFQWFWNALDECVLLSQAATTSSLLGSLHILTQAQLTKLEMMWWEIFSVLSPSLYLLLQREGVLEVR